MRPLHGEEAAQALRVIAGYAPDEESRREAARLLDADPEPPPVWVTTGHPLPHRRPGQHVTAGQLLDDAPGGHGA